MEIDLKLIPQMTIEAFADVNGLVMEVTERDPAYWSRGDKFQPYSAHFKSAEVKDGPILKSEFGDGQTPEEAIASYGRAISLKLLVIDAMDRSKRREIKVPRIVP